MFRKRLARGWYLALGVASFVTLGVLYTILTTVVHANYPNNKTIPTWKQLYEEGLKPAFLPRVETLPKFEWDSEQKRMVNHEQTRVHPPLIWEDGRATLRRLAWGIGLALLLSIPLGLLMGCYQPIEAFFLPPLSFLAKVPPTAVLAIFLVLLATGGQFYAGTILFGLFPILTQTVFHAARDDVPEELLFKARTLGATQIECIWDVVYRYILPKILEASRLQIGPAIVYLIAAEFAQGEVGFGCRMRLLFKSLDMSIIYNYVATLGVIGLLVDWVLIWLQRKICPWYGA